MATSIAWTPSGTAALAEERNRGIPILDGDVAAKVKALFKVHAPAWRRGLDKCDDAGRVFAKLAIAWKPGGKPNIDQLAAVISLSTACDNDEEVMPWFAQWILDELGIEVALRVLIAMWRIVPSYKGKKTPTAWLEVLDADDGHIFDTSASSGKRQYARFLSQRAPAKREAAIAKLWPGAPRYVKPALAVAARDPERGAEIARELLKHDEPHAFYAWEELPNLLRDANLLAKTKDKRGRSATFQMIDNLGAKVLPILVADFAAARDKYMRKRMMELLVNVKSPEVARLLAEYVGQKPYDELVAAYFAQHPALLQPLLDDEELQYHRDDLRKLSAR
jgi:hypothetical protein